VSLVFIFLNHEKIFMIFCQRVKKQIFILEVHSRYQEEKKTVFRAAIACTVF